MRSSVITLCVVAVVGCSNAGDKAGGGGAGGDASGGGAGGEAGGCSADAFDACDWPGPELPTEFFEPTPITSAVTGRELPVRVRYAIDAATPLPVVVWSHGGNTNNLGHQLSAAWGRTLAAAGFAVIHVAHVDFGGGNMTPLCQAAGVPEDSCVRDGFNPLTIARPLDVTAVIDALDDIASELEADTGVVIDTDSVAAAGWSAGSQAPMALAGAERSWELDPPYSAETRFLLPDTRAKAIVALSPQGPDFSGFWADDTASSWSELRAPTLVCTGVADLKPSNLDLLPSIRRQAFDLQPTGGDRYLFFGTLDVGEHDSYDLGQGDDNPDEPGTETDEDVVRLQRAIKSVVIAFLDATLRDDAEARVYLESQAPATLAGGAEWTKR